MAKHNKSRKSRSKSNAKTMRRGQKGGDLAGNPPSSWGWVQGTVGNGWTQFMNSLTLQPGQNLATAQSTQLVPVGNINADNTQGMIGPNLKGDIPGSQSGGKKKVKKGSKKSRGKRGGAILAALAVPGALIAMNQVIGTRHNRKHKHK